MEEWCAKFIPGGRWCVKGCRPITKIMCDRQDLGSYSVAIFSYGIAPQRPGGILPPGLAPAVVLLKGPRGVKSGFSSRGGDGLSSR